MITKRMSEADKEGEQSSNWKYAGNANNCFCWKKSEFSNCCRQIMPIHLHFTYAGYCISRTRISALRHRIMLN